ncbi:unnamed protein product [Acanthoscelides obtectus]|uniref:SCAN domain-containing protein 3 n=1 Tax=Acanthoscelides obtectus TaxID=200917 RepID=A0A9P0KSS5_ACAOB|nr:unnamed protein product [Acanthoscelides obtectus]CAK1660472.1 Protein ZBED8 [Acanthoscelides obtectus]
MPSIQILNLGTYEDILTMVIPSWIVNPYGDIEETNVIIQEELTELSTNEELQVQFKNGYQQFWLQNNIPVTYPKRPTLDRMFASTSQRNDDGLRASYNISLLIAKSGKPHTIGEKLILPAVEEVLKTVLHKPASDIIKRIPLSNNTVERRIDEMSSDIESFLCNYLQTTHSSIQLDESTLPDNAALLLAYVRFIMNQEIYEELLFARTLITDTKGESIFHVLKDYFIEKAIPLSNIISVATDGAPAMIARYREFISYLKQNVSGVLAIHCVIHRQHLVAKNLSVRLHESLHLVIDAVSRIRSNALNTRFEDILTMVIPPWIVSPYSDIEETNVIIQEELTELSTNEEFKVQFKNGYQQFWLQNVPVTYPVGGRRSVTVEHEGTTRRISEAGTECVMLQCLRPSGWFKYKMWERSREKANSMAMLMRCSLLSAA